MILELEPLHHGHGVIYFKLREDEFARPLKLSCFLVTDSIYSPEVKKYLLKRYPKLV